MLNRPIPHTKRDEEQRVFIDVVAWKLKRGERVDAELEEDGTIAVLG